MPRTLHASLAAAAVALALVQAPTTAEAATLTAENVAVDASGNPDSTGQAGQRSSALSGNGRYLFFFTYNGSNLAPPSIYKAGGTLLYLLRKDLQTGEIIVASRKADGVTPERAVDVGDLPTDLAEGVAVNQDGTRVFYGAYSVSGTGLQVTDLAQNQTRVVRAPNYQYVPLDLAISDDGDTVAFGTTTPSGIQVYRQYQQQALERVDNCAVGTGCGSKLGTEGFVDLSGDGGKLVYSEADGSTRTNVHILLYNAATGSTTDLTAPIQTLESFASPAISGDGSTVAAGYRGDGVYGVIKQPLGAGRLGPGGLVAQGGLTAQGGTAQTMSRDGQVFVYTFRDTPGALRGYYKIGTAAAERLPVPAGDWSELNLDISDDGKTVIWHRRSCTSSTTCSATPGIWLTRLP